MRSFFSALASLAFLSTAIASPVITDDAPAKRGNGAEIVYLLTCNGLAHASTAAYYSNWQDSSSYGHQPNAKTSDVDYSSEGWPFYRFPDGTRFTTQFDEFYDPGWYQVAGSASNSYGTQFTCRMDNGRQVYDSCFSNYYCQ